MEGMATKAILPNPDQHNAARHLGTGRQPLGLSAAVPVRWRFHYTVNRLLYAIFGRRLHERIMELVGAPTSIIDIASGDDTLAFEAAKDAHLCVLNDISPGETSKAAAKLGRVPEHVLFTNYDALQYPEEASFDVSICKCVVHHLRRDADFLQLLRKLRRITRRRAVIVDIEDIARNHKARLWNTYYRLLLEDDGGFFMSRDRFFTVIANAYGGHGRIHFESLETFRGVYMIAVIDFDEGNRLSDE